MKLTKTQTKFLTIFRSFIELWPFRRGKQTIAFYIYKFFLQGLSATEIICRDGLKFNLNLRDRMQVIFYLAGLYEPSTASVGTDLLPVDRKSVYLDVGANVGLLMAQIKMKRPLCECHLFEPDKEVSETLKRNIEINGFQSVFVNQNAVSETGGQQVRFHKSYEASESGWGRLENNLNATVGEIQQVSSVSIDDYLLVKKIQIVDLLKIDVEGAEENVIRGAKKTLSDKRIKAIICEVHESTLKSFGTDVFRLKNLLEAFGYKEVRKMELNRLFLPQQI